MRTRAYADAERAIAAADTNTIRERWLYGLRLVNDPDILAPKGGLRHGVADQLIAAAARHKIKLSEREIRRRMQCARAYPKDSQIGHAVAGFGSWRDLSEARFPAYDAPADEPDADWRTPAERKRDRARQLAELADRDQLALFPVDQFELDTPLKDLIDYAGEQADITARFVARDKQRAAYLAELLAAVDDDESVSWRDAHRAAFGEDVEAGEVR